VLICGVSMIVTKLAGIYNLNDVISILVIEKCTTVQGSVSQYRMAFLCSLIL